MLRSVSVLLELASKVSCSSLRLPTSPVISCVKYIFFIDHWEGKCDYHSLYWHFLLCLFFHIHRRLISNLQVADYQVANKVHYLVTKSLRQLVIKSSASTIFLPGVHSLHPPSCSLEFSLRHLITWFSVSAISLPRVQSLRHLVTRSSVSAILFPRVKSPPYCYLEFILHSFVKEFSLRHLVTWSSVSALLLPGVQSPPSCYLEFSLHHLVCSLCSLKKSLPLFRGISERCYLREMMVWSFYLSRFYPLSTKSLLLLFKSRIRVVIS